MAVAAPRCTCCFDRGVVLDINGQPRPCSRCRSEDFDAWARALRASLASSVKTATPGETRGGAA